MSSIIFSTKYDYNVTPNNLIEINSDYNIKIANYGFGLLSKTNIFIGANNSGKSRFLRYLYSTNFKKIDYTSFSKKHKLKYGNEIDTSTFLNLFNHSHNCNNSPYSRLIR